MMLPKGYVVQLYKLSKRTEYNYKGSLHYFNYLLEKRERARRIQQRLLVYGDFDAMEILSIDRFGRYNDVSTLAKEWLGKRQCVLLYSVEDNNIPQRIYCEDQTGILDNGTIEKFSYYTGEEYKNSQHRFVCLSMISLTNQIKERTEDFSKLIKEVRRKILDILDELKISREELTCEVMGSFATSEISIIWLCNQYTYMLRIIDYIKHVSVDVDGLNIPLFFRVYSIIARNWGCKFTQIMQNGEEIYGEALVQISIQDGVKNHFRLEKIAEKIVDGMSEVCQILYSVGEYDLVIKMPAKYAICLVEKENYLCVGKTEENDEGKFRYNLEDYEKIEEDKRILQNREILQNHIKLLYQQDMKAEGEIELNKKLQVLEEEGKFKIVGNNGIFRMEHILLQFDWEQLIRKKGEENNYNFYSSIRKKFKNNIVSSVGAVDMLDLLYTDYRSILSGAYNSIWLEDFQYQFGAVLQEIKFLISSDEKTKMPWSWELFRELANNFKQHIYHLSQSNRMFFEVPSCHLRATGQYDFLMHAYYGFTKKILEVIYNLKGKEQQSELIPLITVDIVPQVKSTLYFEFGDRTSKRVVHLNIPDSMIFDFFRGFRYLIHELFYYVAPRNREKRNYYMGVLLVCEIFRRQFVRELETMLYTTAEGVEDKELKNFVKNKIKNFLLVVIKIDNEILKYVQRNYIEIHRYVMQMKNGTCSEYQRKLYEFCSSSQSDEFFKDMFEYLFQYFCKKINKLEDIQIQKDVELSNHYIKEIKTDTAYIHFKDRLNYCNNDKEYRKSYIESILIRRMYRTDQQTIQSADENDFGFASQVLWNAIREASSDIAMISLTNMTMDEYMLFCVQCWKDINHDNQMPDITEKYRVAMVMEYMQIKQEEWKLESKIKKDFEKKYIWFYRSTVKKSLKNTKDSYKYDKIWRKKIEGVEKWIDLFRKSLVLFNIDFSVFYDATLQYILAEYDLDERVKQLKEERKENIQKLKSEITEKIYREYNEILFRKIDYELWLEEADNETERTFRAEWFQQDLLVAQFLQKQKVLKELGKINAEQDRYEQEFCLPIYNSLAQENINSILVSQENCTTLEDYGLQVRVRSIKELIFYLNYCPKQLKKIGNKRRAEKSNIIWFRGQADSNYYLSPSIMRKFDIDYVKYFTSLRSYQQSEFEEFKFRADGAPEIPSGVRFTTSDYIALMQHYSIPTNFLDWTENAFTSLYFALEEYFEKKENITKDVAIYMFHPRIYNEVRKILLEKQVKENTNNDKLYDKDFISDITKPVTLFRNRIPNLSTKLNEERFNMFLLGNPEFDQEYLEMEPEDSYYSRKNENLFLPLAIWTSRLNSRIRTQSGCFVAFNLYTPPRKNENKNMFEYMALENIQLKCLEKKMNPILEATDISEESEPIFMYKIVIDHSCCKEVVEWLKAMGVSRESVYPELENLQERMIN